MGCSAGSWHKAELKATNSSSVVLISLALELLHAFSVHFRDVQSSFGIDCHEVGQLQHIRPTPARNHLTVRIEVKNLMALAFRNQQLSAGNQKAVRISEAGPDRQAFPIRIENLYAIVTSI